MGRSGQKEKREHLINQYDVSVHKEKGDHPIGNIMAINIALFHSSYRGFPCR